MKQSPSFYAKLIQTPKLHISRGIGSNEVIII